MHQVLEHLLARRGKSVPVNDGRKISLVLYGGTMAAIRTCAALATFDQLGLTNAFDRIYTVSVSFPVACYFLSGQISTSIEISYNHLSGRRFINPFRFWKLIDILYLLNLFRTGVPLDVKTLLQAKTQLYTSLYNVEKNDTDYYEIHDFNSEDKLFSLMHAATSVHYLNPGHVRINNIRYMDNPHNLRFHYPHLEQVLKSDATDILVLYTYHGQLEKTGPLPSHVCEIEPPKEWKLSRITTNGQKLHSAALQMIDFIQKILDTNEKIIIPPLRKKQWRNLFLQ